VDELRPPDETRVNVLLRWQDEPVQHQVTEQTASDRFDAMVAQQSGAVFERLPDLASKLSSQETFEWSEERGRAIEAALHQLGQAPRPAVVQQFEAVREALLLGTLEPRHASELLGELLGYLDERVDRWHGKPATSDPQLTEARISVKQALLNLRDAVLQLTAYASEREAATMVLAQRLAEQSMHSLEEARLSMLAAEPVLPTAQGHAPAESGRQGEDTPLAEE
jgi:hypothetical protein